MVSYSIWFRLAYLLGRTPWDTGVTPPELLEVVEGAEALPPGQALELGCGTGTNAVYLARHGWRVTGVDLAGRAIARARRRAARAGVSPRLLVGDVTRLDRLGVGGGYTLLFDLGCFHAVPPERRDAYAAGVTAATAPGAILLMYGFGPGRRHGRAFGVEAAELRRRFAGWELEADVLGTDPFQSHWYRLRRL